MSVTRIREATIADGASILALAHRFLEGTPYGQVLPYSPDALATLLVFLLEHKRGIVYLGEERGGGCDEWEDGKVGGAWERKTPPLQHRSRARR